MKVIIGGDVVPTLSNIGLFKRSDFINNLDDKFIEVWNNADFRLFNLECPLGENLTPIKKSGPNLIAPSNCIKGIKSLQPNLICLSNNHILDYGLGGLKNTRELLNENGIEYTGIIKSIDTRIEPFYFIRDGIKVGVFNLCETEFTVASISEGANPFRGIETYKEINRAKEKCDFLIVVFHGGKEFYRYPSPNFKEMCESFIIHGADFVVTQHSHCIGTFEKFMNKTIVYGQGNFIFDREDNEFWNSGLIIELNITKNNYEVRYIPIERNSPVFKISSNEEILNGFYKRSKQIQSKEFVIESYKKFADTHLNDYMRIFEGNNSIIKKVLRKLFKIKINKKRDIQNYLDVLNVVRCEAHRELLIQGLENKIDILKGDNSD